jgi:hypothetical protein
MKDYFARMIERTKNEPVLPLMKSSCGDCAIECGFYGEYVERLRLTDVETQQTVASKWFCHNNMRMACHGVKEFLNVK